MTRRVLFVSYVFPPMPAGGSVRTGQLARFLPERGWEVSVVTVACSPSMSVDAPAVEALPSTVQVHRAKGPNQLVATRGRPNVQSGWTGRLRRLAVGAASMAPVPDRQIGWYPAACRVGRRALATTSHDVVLASFGPATSAIVGARLARQAGLPFVLDYRDLWSDTPHDLYFSSWHRRRAAARERKCVQQAVRITCASEPMAEHLASQHSRAPAEVVAVPNGFDPAWASPHTRTPDGPLRLVYTGAVHRFQSVGRFLQGLRLAADRGLASGDLHVTFVGNLDPGVPRDLGVADFVTCESFKPHEEVRRILAKSDCALLIERPGYRGKFSYSAKTFDYAVTGMPVLALVEEDSNSAGLLRELDTATIVPPDNPDAIAKALLDLANGSGPSARAVNISESPLKDFNRRTLAARLAGVLDEARQVEPR